MENLQEKLIESNTKFSGNILSVKVDQIELPDGNRSKREIVEHSGGVTIIPCTSEGDIVMVVQYRHAAEQVMLELPAGRLEEKEKAAQGARRELKEETGYRAGEMIYLFNFYTTPGYSTECLNLFLARDLIKGDQELEKGEFLKIKEVSPKMIPELIFSGQIKDSKTALGLLAYLYYDAYDFSDE